MNPEPLKKTMYEVVYEYFGFEKLCCTNSCFLSLIDYKYDHPTSVLAKNCCALVVDSGFSFTHAVPFFDEKIINFAIKRLDIGGKGLTNYLKEVISYRQWNMMEETYLVNIIKERLCYVSLNFMNDLETSKKKGRENTIRREYVLPDYIKNLTGYIKEPTQDNQEQKIPEEEEEDDDDDDEDPNDYVTNKEKKDKKPEIADEQILAMNNERITVPELLFHPSDIGINQSGIPETITQAIEATPTDMHAPLYDSILLTGGNVVLPYFNTRVSEEVRQATPSCFAVNVFTPEDPILSAWRGGVRLANNDSFERYCVSKHQYEENGSSYCQLYFTSAF